MEFTTSLQKFTDKNASVYGLHFPVPKPIAQNFIAGENRRVICTVNQSFKLSSGLMPFQEYWYILVNQEVKKQLNLEIGDEVVIHLEKDRSEYGMPMPEELMVLLDQDELGHRYFHELTPGKQRNLIYLVNKVKNVDSRLNKALAIVDHLKEYEGKLDFKALHVKIKEYNQRNKMNF